MRELMRECVCGWTNSKRWLQEGNTHCSHCGQPLKERKKPRNTSSRDRARLRPFVLSQIRQPISRTSMRA